jgi:outer membrane immunogenic protein
LRHAVLSSVVVSALIVGSSAYAADLPVPLPVNAPPPCSWCGPYVGINIGAAFDTNTSGNLSGNAPTAALYAAGALPTALQLDPGGIAGGAQVGFNWEVGELFVFGAEADFQGSTYVGSLNLQPTPTVGDSFSAGSEQHGKWFGTLRARAGFLPWYDLLVYATGGLAFGQTEVNFNVIDLTAGCPPAPGATCGSASATSTHAGWSAGAGLEWMVSSNVTLKIEYLLVDLGTASVTGPVSATAGGCVGCTFTASAQFRESLVRGGVNFVFNGL